jgi:phosphoribosylformylglycinamidine synthase
LFNESQSRVVISVAPQNLQALLDLAAKHGVPAQKIGEVTTGTTLEITVASESFTWPLADLQEAWAGTIGRLMEA